MNQHAPGAGTIVVRIPHQHRLEDQPMTQVLSYSAHLMAQYHRLREGLEDQ